MSNLSNVDETSSALQPAAAHSAQPTIDPSIHPSIHAEMFAEQRQANPFPEHVWRKIGSHFPKLSKNLFYAELCAPFQIEVQTCQDIHTLICYLDQGRADHVCDIQLHRVDGFEIIRLVKQLTGAILCYPIREGTPLQRAIPSILTDLFVLASRGPSGCDDEAIRDELTCLHTEVGRLLLNDERVDPSAHNNLALLAATDGGCTEMVCHLLNDPRVDPSAHNNCAIRLASLNGHIEIVHLLLNDARVDPSADDNRAICSASCKGHIEVVRVLLNDPRVDPSADNNEAIRWASCNGHAEVVCHLLNDPRVDPSADNNEAIREASEKGHNEVVRLLLNDPRVDPRVDPSADSNAAIREAS